MTTIFLTYRRDDSAATAGRIYDRLVLHFGVNSVFKDVDNIPAGVDFPDYIAKAIKRATVQLVIIGSRWLDMTDDEGRRRLDDPGDHVRLEVEAALNQGISVIPLLLDGVTMPAAHHLPPSLARLSRLNAISVRYDPDFSNDMRRVIAAIERTETEATVVPNPTVPPQAPPSSPIPPAPQKPHPTPPSTPLQSPLAGAPMVGPYQGLPPTGQPVPPGVQAYRQAPMAPPPYMYPQGAPFAAPPTVKLAQERRKTNVWLIVTPIAVLLLACVSITLFASLSGFLSGLGGVSATATKTPVHATATSSSETVIYENSMTGSQTDWQNDAACSFKPDGYHITASFICYAPPEDVVNVVVTVTAKQISGATNAFYGITLRRTSKGNYYTFEIDGNGKWTFDVVKNSVFTALVDITPNPAILAGLGGSNTLQVRAVGAHFVFSVNGTQIGQTDDSTFSSGLIGLSGSDGIDIVYTQFKATQPGS